MMPSSKSCPGHGENQVRCAEGKSVTGHTRQFAMWVVGVALLAGCAGNQEAPSTPPNVLVLLTDDQGTDQIGVYAEHPDPPLTPRMDALAAEGVLFRNAWANPTCSPTRAALLTGRLGRRTGVGDALQYAQGRELPLSEVTLPEALAVAPVPYASAAIGKWHLSAYNSPTAVDHPNVSGFDYFAGSMANLNDHWLSDGLGHHFYHWEKITNGNVEKVDRFATTVTVDDTLAQMRELPEPWFLYVAFNAPHKPLMPPPEELHHQGALGVDSGERVLYRANVEALDAEIGRLLDEMDPEIRARTTVIFASDNGTPSHAIREPWDAGRGKQTPYEGGVNVPLIIAGPQVEVPGSESLALVNVLDIFATALEVADASPPEGVQLDSQSLVPFLADPENSGRDIVYTERFVPSGPPPYNIDWRISRDGRFKVVDRQVSVGLFDLADRDDDGDPIELESLDEASRAQAQGLLDAQAEHWEGIEGPSPL